MTQLIYGAKAGSQQPKQPTIAKDTVASISRLKILYALTEGEARGLVAGAASIILESTPLLDSDGNKNFEDVEWEIRTGTVDQAHIAGMPNVSNEVAVGTVVRSGTPWTRTINDTQLSSVNVNVSWPRLSETTSDFDVIGTEVNYKIEVRTDGGSYITVLNGKIKDKTSGQYQRTHNIKLPEAVSGWQIRVTKITPDGDGERKFNAMQIDSIAEIIDAKLRYPHTALLYLSFDARTFSSIPKVAVDFYGRYLQVPSNYDAESRTSTGLWDGTFKQAYTDNPAWAYYDLITNDRYGLGDKLKPFMINKWAIEYIARICDEMVDDGNGGTEPRFACNLYLQKAEDAYRVLQHLAGIFRGMSFWNGSQIVLDADTYRDADYVITAANVVDGEFVKTGTALADRHTVAKVAYSNPNNNYETDYVMVRNEAAIAQRGINMLDIAAVGCTSEGQAYRMGLAALLTEQNRTQTVSFAMGLDGTLPEVGSRVDIADPMFTGYNNGGRISAVSADFKVITVDRDEVPATAGYQLTVNLESGKAQTRDIVSVNGREITVSAAFDPVAAENAWAISTDEMPTMPFIVLAVTGNDDGTQYNYTALQYDSTLYPQIDNGTLIEPRPPLPSYNPFIILEPEAVTVSSRHRVVQGLTVTTLVITWSQVDGAVAYEVEWRKDDGDWIKMPRTGNISIDIDGVYSGNYIARVRAVSAFDAVSKPTSSMLTAIVGKVGRPPKILSLIATGILFGMKIDWTFAPGSSDTAYTEIQVASAPDVNVAALGQFAYKTNTHTINGLQGNLTQYYRARIVDKLGNTSDWTTWISGTTDASADKIMDLIQGQITESALSDILASKIDDIAINKQDISNETQARVAAIIAANDRITDEAADRVEALRLASERTNDLQDFADNLANDVDTVTLAQAQTANGLAVVKERADAFEIENGVQAQKLTYLSSEIGMGYADKTKYANSARSTAWTFAKTVAHADYTNAQMIRGLSADYQDSSARFTEEINLIASKNEALATKTSNLSAQLVGGYDGNDLTKLTSGLVFEESRARSTDVEGLAEQISLLSAGVGEQFDSFEIWHFNKNKDGWTNGTYSNGWLNVRAETITSPAIVDLDGAVYKHVKMRIKKAGTPTWQGLLSYSGGSQTVTEPSYDADGIALVNWQADWTGDITSFSLKLASAGDNLNYYSIDWIAVGRPSPGASNAALLRESSVRASETSANAADLLALNSQINGGGAVPIESSITKKLDTTATLADTTANDLSILKSDYEDDMYGYEGTVQTTARTLASATQAEAERLDLLSANILPAYADKTQYASATRSTQWTYAKTVAADNYAANQRITALQSDFDNSTSNINKELFTLTEKDKSIAADVTQLYADTDKNYGLIQDLDLAISTPVTGLSARITETKAVADSAVDKLKPQNIGSIVEQSGAFADEFGAIAGDIKNIEGIVDGQKSAIEVVSAVGDADKLKNEIAKARLDKDATHLNVQSTALTNSINSYTAKIAGLNAKRDAPKDPDMSQSQYNALRAEYAKQIADITAARADLTAQKAAISDQVTQLNNEKEVLDSLKATESDVKAQHTIKIDAGGKIAGYGLVVQKNNFSAFDVRADRFSISAPVGKPNDINGTSPFMVLTNAQNIDGVTVPAGVYARNFYAPRASIDTIQIKDAAVKSAQIDNLAVTTAKIGQAQVDSLQIKGQAVSISSAINKRIRVEGADLNPIAAGNVSGKSAVELEDRYLNSSGNPVVMELYFYGTEITNAGSANKITIEMWAGLDLVEEFRFYRSYQELSSSFKAVYSGFNGNLRYYAKVTCTSGSRLEAASYLFSVSTLKR